MQVDSTERAGPKFFGYIRRAGDIQLASLPLTRMDATHAWAKDASISAFDFSAMPTATLPRKVSKPWRIGGGGEREG